LPQPWYKSGVSRQDYPWVDLQKSLQWHAFQRVVQTLQERGNRVFVLVGPFNEHLLNPASLQRYQGVQATIAAWLVTHQIAHTAPPPLPSELYGDASHPLAQGYAALAHQLLEQPFFRSASLPAQP
jgi:DNA-binding transcriptional regulator of glucitol operon